MIGPGPRRLRRALILVCALPTLALWASDSVVAPRAVAAVRSCDSYPRPGTTSTASVPSGVRTEYGVLRRPQRPADRIALRRLGLLPESGILVNGIHYLGEAADGGRAYLVPSLHLLSSPLVPARCVPGSQRALQRALAPSLRREYGHRGLCLVMVYEVGATPACQSAPGSVDSLLLGPGTAGLGIVPDGVPAVRMNFRHRAPIRAVVHANFWIILNRRISTPPCGLDWITRGGVVLRTVASCNGPDLDS